MTQVLRVKRKDDTIILNLATANVVKVIRYEEYSYIQVMYGKYSVHIRTPHESAWAFLQSLRLQSLKEPQEPQQVHELYADTCDVMFF